MEAEFAPSAVPIFYIPVCTPEKMKCVDNISLEKDTKCLRKCSGILVTAFDNHMMSKKSMKFISTLSNMYWN